MADTEEWWEINQRKFGGDTYWDWMKHGTCRCGVREHPFLRYEYKDGIGVCAEMRALEINLWETALQQLGFQRVPVPANEYTCNFGKYRNRPVSDVCQSYVDWCKSRATPSDDMVELIAEHDAFILQGGSLVMRWYHPTLTLEEVVRQTLQKGLPRGVIKLPGLSKDMAAAIFGLFHNPWNCDYDDYDEGHNGEDDDEEEQEEEEQLEQGDPSDVNDTAAMDQGNDLPSGGVLHGNTSMDQSTSSIDSGATTPCVTYFSGSHVASPINHNNNHSRSHATTINSTYCPIGKALVLQEEKQQLLIPRSSASASGPGAGNGAGSELISKDSSSEWQIFTEDMYNLNGGKFTKAELRARTPWGMFFTHPVALTLLFANFGYGWIGFTLLSEMPSYLTDILGFNLTSAGFLCVFPYLALFIASLSFGKLFDWLQHEHNWHTLTVRRSAMVVANVASAAVLVMCGYLENKFAAYAFMVATQVFYGAAQAGIGCAYTDAAPTYSSSLNSLGNTMGAMAGILGPIIVAACTEEWSGVYGWRVAFYITFALSCAIVAVWFRVMTADIVPALNTPARL
mmetsp:Transcript_8444/g.14015  ORF Transcript_8444/g.14015 Transcript_8444/m.14015 type:complete len:568 (+) Transcript_8444:51-1754(+)